MGIKEGMVCHENWMLHENNESLNIHQKLVIYCMVANLIIILKEILSIICLTMRQTGYEKD